MSVKARKEDLLFLGAGVLLCIEILILLSQMRLIPMEFPWFAEKKNQPSIGYVVEKTQTLKDRSGQSLSWYPLAKGDSIHANDIVMTGPGSSALIKIEGEGELSLGADTFITFGIDRSNPKRSVLQLEMEQGNITVSSTDKPITVRMKNREVKLQPKTQVVLSRTVATKEEKVLVKTGKLEIGNTAVSAGETFKLAETKIEKVDTTIHAELTYPKEGSHLVAKEKLELIQFRWTGDLTASVEIDDNPEFSTPKIASRLEPGRYYWRLRKGDATSPAASFTLLPPIEYSPLSPLGKKSIKQGTEIYLSWAEVPNSKIYHVQVSRTPTFDSLYLEEDFNKTEASLGRLDPGTYYWRIRAEHETLGSWPISSVYSFTVKKALSAPKPRGVKRLKKSEIFPLLEFLIPSAYADDGSGEIQIEWEETKGANSYRLEVAEDEKFQKLIHHQEVKGTSATVTLPQREKYYWRVAGLDHEGELGPYSEPQSILYSELFPPQPAPIPVPTNAPLAEKKKVKVIARKKDPVRIENSLSLGLSGHYIKQSADGESIDAEQSGLPLGRLDLEAKFLFNNEQWMVSGWYEPRKFESKNTLPSDIQPKTLYKKEFGVQGLWLVRRFEQPFSIGLRYEESTQFARIGAEHADAQNLRLFSLVGGPSFSWGRKPYLKTSLLLVATPVGAKGVGLDAVGALGYPRAFFGSITPELRLGFQPSYYSVEYDHQKLFTYNFSFGLFLAWHLESKEELVKGKL